MALATQSVVMYPDNKIRPDAVVFGFHRWRVVEGEPVEFPKECHSQFAILQQYRDGGAYLWMCYTPTDATIDHAAKLTITLNQEPQDDVRYRLVTEYDDLLSIPFDSKIPPFAVKLNYAPVTAEGVGCDIDFDIDRFGRTVVFINQQWWGWYAHPNEPLV